MLRNGSVSLFVKQMLRTQHNPVLVELGEPTLERRRDEMTCMQCWLRRLEQS